MKIRRDRDEAQGRPTPRDRAGEWLFRPVSFTSMVSVSAVATFSVVLSLLVLSGSLRWFEASLSAMAACSLIFTSQVAVWFLWVLFAPSVPARVLKPSGIRHPGPVPPLWDRELDG